TAVDEAQPIIIDSDTEAPPHPPTPAPQNGVRPLAIAQYFVPGAPRLHPIKTPPAYVTFPQHWDFTTNNYNQTDDFNVANFGAALEPGPWPGLNVNVINTIKRQQNNNNPSIAFNAQVIQYLVLTIQFLGSAATIRDPPNQDPDDDGVWGKVEDHVQFYRATEIMEQWASYKQKEYHDPSLSRQLQEDQVAQNTAPAATTTAIDNANTTIERRALLTLAGRGGFGRGEGRGRGGRGGRGRGNAHPPAQISSA
ncbi:hypothetical protein BGX30_006398, partial [Mortierella sp. GBA39]